MTYTKIKTDFVKNELKKTPWKKRDYINDLIKIEGHASGKRFGLVTGYQRNHLIEKYPQQWKAIWQELNPEGYRRNLAEEKKEAAEERKLARELKKQEKAEEEKEKEEWEKMGGR